MAETSPKNSRHVLDQSGHLRDWGFTASYCNKCGIHNSQISGLLMQCGKCKKAYYCSMKCFNDDLAKHRLFCMSDKIYTEPKQRCTIVPTALEEISDDDMTKPQVDPTRNERDIQVDNSENFVEIEEEDDDDESVDEDGSTSCTTFERSGSDHHNDCDDCAEEINNIENETADLSPIRQERKRMEEDPYASETVLLRRTEPHGGKDYAWEIPDWASNSPLRKTEKAKLVVLEVVPPTINDVKIEIEKGEYGWEVPEWAKNRHLRPTGKGDLLKNSGNLALPVTNIHSIVEKGELGWQKPDWTISVPLKETDKGHVVKTQGNLARPITHIHRFVQEGELGWEKPGYCKEKNVKETVNGSKLRSGSDITRPITKGAKLSFET